MREPLLLPLVAIICGILASRALNLRIAETVWPMVAFALLAIISGWRNARWLITACSLLATLFLGAAAEAWHRPGPKPTMDAGPHEIVVFEGCIVEPSSFSSGRQQFTLELEPGIRARVTQLLPDDSQDPAPSTISPGTISLGSRAPSVDESAFHYGQRVEIEARVRTPRNFQNPGAFDYVQYLARRGVFWTATMAPKSPAPRVLPGRCGSRFWSLIFELREAALARIGNLFPNDSYTSGMMQAILLGENSHMEDIWTRDFRKTGTIHALVISGTHVAVLAMILLFVLRWCGISELPALAATASTAWLYALVSGFSAPVVRAAGGYSLYLLARFFFRRGRSMNLLAAVAIVFLLCDPSELGEASFQLSFLAAAALGALAIPLLETSAGPYRSGMRGIAQLERDPHLEPKVTQCRIEIRLAAEALSALTPLSCMRANTTAKLIALTARAVLLAAELVLISAAMQVGLALPMAQYFHRVSISGLSANVLIVPLLELTVPIGFGAIFTGWHTLAELSAWLLKLASRIAAWHAHMEPSWRLADPPWWLFACLVAALTLFAIAVRYRVWRVPALIPVAALFSLLIWQPWPPATIPNTLELTVIDVGQGESLLVVFPEGATMLIDGGGVLRYGRKRAQARLDTGEDVVSPYLWSRGIRHLDIVAVTHAHEDHTGGIAALLDNFRPNQVWLGTNPAQPLLRHAAELGIPVAEQRKGVPFQYSGATVEILSPSSDPVIRAPGNNDSLVLRISYKKRSFLLTGDIEGRVEDVLDSNGQLAHADVLKVGHHGSRTSTSPEFLEAVSPSIAVVSSGYQNPFGHPHRDVLERLSARGVATLRTDRDGLVSVRTDRHKLFFSNELWDRASKPIGFNALYGRGWREILVH